MWHLLTIMAVSAILEHGGFMTRSVLVTGCSSGLGKEVALGFAARGYRVFAGVRKAEDVYPLMSYGDSVTPVVLDLRNRELIAEAAKSIDQQCGADGLSILVNMAGYTFVSPFEYTEEESARDLFDVLFFGPAALTKALLPALKRNIAKRGSRPKVMNIISWAAIDASPFVGFYSGAKAAFLRLSEAQFYEFQSIGVDAIAILPGLMKTPFVTMKTGSEIATTLARLPEKGQSAYADSLSRMAGMGRSAQSSSVIPKPDSVAKRILKIAEIKSPRSRYLIGTDTHLVNLLNKLFPLCLLETMKVNIFRIKRRGLFGIDSQAV
jgi:NAD(P)-dependent dehydrogenase (short-subunit alcohol dehydrogenase family)